MLMDELMYQRFDYKEIHSEQILQNVMMVKIPGIKTVNAKENAKTSNGILHLENKHYEHGEGGGNLCCKNSNVMLFKKLVVSSIFS